jgi:hypothetical protein
MVENQNMIKINGRRLIKNYFTYISESRKPKFFNVYKFLSNYVNSVIAEDELRKLVIGETCIFYIKGNFTLKKEKIGDVNIKGSRVYFNGYEVDQDFDVEIEESKISKTTGTLTSKKDWEILGLPSGEIITVNTEQLKKLMKANLVRYESWIHWKNLEFKDIYFFQDVKYYKIMQILDPNYSLPRKNINQKNNYYINDIIVCEGIVDEIHVDNCVGKIIDMYKKEGDKEYRYLISFMFKFSPELIHISDNEKYCWWVKRDNIKGEYAGDLDNLIHLNRMQEEKGKNVPLEEYEVDDDYHIKQLFKKFPNVKSVGLEKKSDEKKK